MKHKIFTLGYEKKSINEFISILKEAKVDVLVDVRERAWSYKRDFCKTKFSDELSKRGIEYVHVRTAGNPRAFRIESSSKTEILKKYRKYLVRTNSGIPELEEILERSTSAGKNICLTCFEKQHDDCHRSVLTDFLQKVHKGIKVAHL